MNWYIVRNGEILFTVDSEEEAIWILAEDESGELEYYPERGFIR